MLSSKFAQPENLAFKANFTCRNDGFADGTDCLENYFARLIMDYVLN